MLSGFSSGKKSRSSGKSIKFPGIILSVLGSSLLLDDREVDYFLGIFARFIFLYRSFSGNSITISGLNCYLSCELLCRNFPNNYIAFSRLNDSRNLKFRRNVSRILKKEKNVLGKSQSLSLFKIKIGRFLEISAFLSRVIVSEFSSRQNSGSSRKSIILSGSRLSVSDFQSESTV